MQWSCCSLAPWTRPPAGDQAATLAHPREFRLGLRPAARGSTLHPPRAPEAEAAEAVAPEEEEEEEQEDQEQQVEEQQREEQPCLLRSGRQ
mmetsp:Transcript_80640/g.168133  ORF Transcript_80640/g.168133 Transcript_80640/m.168133 type:complete len:91 (+) Transcript_80640:803-1075(+)